MFDQRAATSTAILDLSDDCLYCIFTMLSTKDQLQLVNTCERFRYTVRQMIWRKQFQKIRSIDLNTDQLNNQEYQQFFYHIAEYLEDFTIDDNEHVVYSCYLGCYLFRPELTFYLSLHFPRLTRLECLDGRLHDSHMRMIVENCPQLQILKVSSDHITGAHIKDMSNLHELYIPGCSLSSEHLSDIFMHLKITHLDVSDCNINLLIDEQTWAELRFLKMSGNQLKADFVKKCTYLRALNCLTLIKTHGGSFLPHWSGLFESLGSIITTMNLYHTNDIYAMSAIAKNTSHLTALKKIISMVGSISDLRGFARLPALEELHLFTYNVLDVDTVKCFIAQTEYLEHLDLICCGGMFDINFDWLLDVIRILRQQKERQKLCLNLVFTDNMCPIRCDEIKRMVMAEQNNKSQPLLEVTFNNLTNNRQQCYSFISDGCIELYFKRI